MYKYRIPFTHSLKNSKTTFNNRKGIILQLNNKGTHFFGEAAPLSGFSNESLDEVESNLKNHQQKLTKILDSDDLLGNLQNFYKDNTLPPSLSFAIDSIAYRMAALKNNQTFSDFLFTDYQTKIAVNALGDLLSESVLADIEQKVLNGFKTFKFKVGIDFKAELHVLNSIRKQFPDIRIRLDANQSWTREDSITNLRTLESLDIEYCEEPLRDASAENISLISDETSIPIALDESLPHAKNSEELMSAADTLIIKPTLWGRFQNIIQLKQQAAFHNCDVIFTTTLETGIGRMFTAQLAAGLGSKSRAHGLATGSFLSQDIISDSDCISGGYYHISKAMKQMKNIHLTEYSFLQEV